MSGPTGGCQCGAVRFTVDGELGRKPAIQRLAEEATRVAGYHVSVRSLQHPDHDT